ncbi:DUF739 domain-containing protein [Sneathia sanguinegens]|uniref:DUF739 domain-containing protein n=1 Tax=Sneathia sanguinegens TaxID=40543 RepID=UPI00258FE6B7|nr:DUF739 domain-containing protein [Sneathia sanguinegens]MDU4653088.1 DUF739 domain-containing protein [Sneathia sanguinegens]
MNEESLRLLQSKIVLNGFILKTFIAKIGMSNQAWYNKIKGLTKFNSEDIEKICITLHLTNDEKDLIFFKNLVE